MRKFSFTFFLLFCSFFFLSFHKINGDPNEKSNVKFIYVDIFGKNYAKTPIIDKKLKGEVYYLSSGHGGPDPGAMAKKDGHTLCEDEYAYDVSLRLARNLLSHGAKVYVIIRDENDGIRDESYLEMDNDEVVWGDEPLPLNQTSRLKQRVDVINKLYESNKRKGYKVQRSIFTHVDSRYTSNKIDIFFYHKTGNSQGAGLANHMYKTIKNKYDLHQNDRGYYGEVKTRDLYVLRETKPTSVFIELGNITNTFDQKRLLISNNRQAISNWLCEGLMTYN